MPTVTPSGRALIAATAMLLLGGWLTDYPELVALGFAGGFALGAAGIWMLVRPDVIVERSIHPSRVTEGDQAHVLLTATNIGGRRSPPLLAIVQVGLRSAELMLPSMAANASCTTTYTLDTSRRGVHTLGSLIVGHTDPLRLLYTSRALPSDARLWVHPRVVSISRVPMGRSRDREGPTSGSAPRGGIAFHSLREYEPGDDLRLIHWPSTARAGTLMVRHNVVPEASQVHVVLDTSTQPYSPEAFEEAVRVTASVSVATLRCGDPLTLQTTGGATVVVRTQPDMRRSDVLDLLAAVAPHEHDPGLDAVPRIASRGQDGTLVIVTGRLNPRVVTAVSRVRGRYAAVHVVFVGPHDDTSTIPTAGRLSVATADELATAWNRVVGQ